MEKIYLTKSFRVFLSLPHIYFWNQIHIAILIVTQCIVSWNPTNSKISAKNWIRLCSPARDVSNEISSVSKNDAMILVKHAAYTSTFGNSKCTILTWFYVARGTWICFIRILRAISLPEASSFPTVSEGCLWNIEITLLLHPVERHVMLPRERYYINIPDFPIEVRIFAT